MPRRDAATIVLAGVMPTALGLAINFATDGRHSLWPWIAVAILTTVHCSMLWQDKRRADETDGQAKRNPVKVPSQLHRDDGHRWRFSKVPAALASVAMALGSIVALGPAFLAPTPPLASPPPLTPQRVDTPAGTSPQTPRRSETPAGTWLSADETFETLYLEANGTYRLDDPIDGDESGRFEADSARITVIRQQSPAQVFSWSMNDSMLTLTSNDGSTRVYVQYV